MNNSGLLTCACLVVVLVYLWGGGVALNRRLRRIPLRICVTGTRGKSSVTRLIASVLREAGYSVLAKTTGSRPAFIFPDGREELIQRKGIPSILEQQRVVRIAAKLKVQAFVVEMMSIQPESMFVESTRLLQPKVMVITNTWIDHREHWGHSRERIARCFAAAIPEGSTVFVPAEEVSPVFRESSRVLGSRIIPVSEESSGSLGEGQDVFPNSEFEQNVRLAAAVAGFIKINPKTVRDGITRAVSDFGGLKVWSIQTDPAAGDWYLVSAFAANDPESTQRVLEKLKRKDWWEGKKVIGLLNLRQDRGDRTQQWIGALSQKAFPELNKLVLLGNHAMTAKRRIQRKVTGLPVLVFKKKSAIEIIATLFALQTEPAVVIGMGNMQGAGEALVQAWQHKGKAHVL